LELVQLVAARGEALEKSQSAPALCRCVAPLTDYFHWQTLARALTKDEEALNEALGFVRRRYQDSVLPHIFEFHKCVDSGFYAGASLVARRLVELYPESVDYNYYLAYALFEDGDYPGARKILETTLSLTGETDAEVVGLLGHCHAKLGGSKEAAHYLRRAVALLKADGLPTSHISLELSAVEEELRGDQLDPALEMPRMTRKWLVNLSPRRYHEFVTSSDSAVDKLLRPMGDEPQPGDICFFATSSPSLGGEGGVAPWRIVGIYAVDSEPMWHPTRRYHSALKLIARLPVGIPVDVETPAEPEAERPAHKGAPIHFGVYELDNHAIDIIEEAVRLSRDEMIERRKGGGQSRRPTA
jgi:tetratricopeptide (TPR) repeat protein